ncbi:MAG: helix-turn-helix domain-containing protein [Planctomycetes bacterium]|nr:helix-turn-helix domain-containing protein [Planctomycetota bacterium]
MKTEFSCADCPLRLVCETPCPPVEALLPNEDRGRIFPFRRRAAEHYARWLDACMRDSAFLTDNRRLLPRDLRRVFDMTYNDGLSQQQIAQRIGVHRRTVGHWLEKARRLIMEQAMKN